ncbi:MAG: sensor histidine kinase [Oscillospiraceae bacterium]|nr:sensor histidine kinase [Oscillospiraceae bacterium]
MLMLSELGLILINIICLYITSNLSETHKREEHLLVEKKQNEYTQKYAQTVKEQYEQTRRLRHDMKQYCTVLDGLIVDKKYDEARAFISENYKSISRSEVVVDVGNDFVNSILNAKLTLAKSLGIEVICSVEKELSGIESADLCNLLGNMLDNAIEAAQRCELEKRSIELNISSVGNRLNIAIRNSIIHSVLKENPSLATSKPDKFEHGFGIKTIKTIAEKYGGTTDFYEDNLTFVCRVELQKSAKEE